MRFGPDVNSDSTKRRRFAQEQGAGRNPTARNQSGVAEKPQKRPQHPQRTRPHQRRNKRPQQGHKETQQRNIGSQPQTAGDERLHIPAAKRAQCQESILRKGHTRHGPTPHRLRRPDVYLLGTIPQPIIPTHALPERVLPVAQARGCRHLGATARAEKETAATQRDCRGA